MSMQKDMGSAVSCSRGSIVAENCYSSPSDAQSTSTACRTVGQATAPDQMVPAEHELQRGMEGAAAGGVLQKGPGKRGSGWRQKGSKKRVRPIDTEALSKLLVLKDDLKKGEVPEIKDLLKTIDCAIVALSTNVKSEEEKKMDRIGDWQVREWLSATFTRSDSMYEAHPPVAKNSIAKFKAAANTIIISNYLGNTIHKDPEPELQYSEALTQHLQHIDDWDFDIFALDTLTGGRPLRYVGHHLLKKHNLFEKCEISASKFDSFLVKIEEGYRHHGNPYHNACHGADVAQTVHYILQATGFEALLSSVEVLSMLIAAIIHDVDHPGTSNNFQINKHSEYALLYNDRSVLENHHLHFSFSVLQEADCNFLNLSSDDFKLLRGLMIEMVLATDMSSHFDQLTHVKHVMATPDGSSQLQGIDRAKMFGLLLHQADISHPGKPWEIHQQWSTKLEEEFYKQGDEEELQGLPISPLCNRSTGNLPKSQLGFIEFIVAPSFKVCGDMLNLVLTTPDASHDPAEPVDVQQLHDPAEPVDVQQLHDPAELVDVQRHMWEQFLAQNKSKWEQQEMLKDAEVKSTTRKTCAGEASGSNDHTPSVGTPIHDPM